MMYDIAATIGISALAGALAYLGLSPRMAEIIYLPALFEPHKFPRGNWDMSWLDQKQGFRDVSFPTANGAKLHGWYFRVPLASATLLVHHGNTGNVADLVVLISLLLKTGVNILVYDYRGYGKSESNPSTARICEDGIAAYDWLAKEYPDMPILLYGESLGGAVACYVAERRPTSALILQSAFFEMRRIAKETYAFFAMWPPSLFQQPYLNNARVLAKLACPVLLLHGAKDAEVNPAHSRDMFQVSHSEKKLVILPNTAHTEIDQNDSELFLASVTDFISRLDIDASKVVAAEQR